MKKKNSKEKSIYIYIYIISYYIILVFVDPMNEMK